MVEEMKVRKGYKKTKGGIIPEDWSALKVKDVMSFSGGSQPPKYTFINERKLGYIRLIQIRDYKSDNFITFIPEELANKKCNKDDIMIGRYGPPIFQILRGIEGAYNVALMKAIPSELIKREYLYYFLKQESLFNFIELLSRRSSGQTGVDIVALKEYSINLPSLKEQDIITKALTDTDNLIQSIEKLINKKEKIKQGTMQELLTGKKRLDGFSGEWEVKKLVEIGDIVTGNTPPTSDSDNYGGDFLFVGPGDLGINKYIKTTEKKLSNKGSALARIYPVNSILVTCIGSTIGKIGVAYEELSSNQQINAVIPNNTYSSDFMYYALGNISHKIRAAASEQAVPIINKSTFGLIEILVPKLEEQKAIAQILSDMDQEIQGLKEKLEKYKTIKQGMMQELLTGRIRLI